MNLDDGGPRHRAFGAHRAPTTATAASRCTACNYGWRCPSRTRKWRRVFSIPRPTDIPELRENGLTLRVIAGKMHGLISPVATTWETIFAERI